MAKFKNANKAFEFFYDLIQEPIIGEDFANTKAMFNVGFAIENPLDNDITCKYRKWNKDYAEAEWQWYLSANQNAEEISKRAPIWKNHMDPQGNVQSNYGWQWVRGSQLDRIIDQLAFSKVNKTDTRQAVITFYDGKEIANYAYDTPCTLSAHFQIVQNKLCMTVNMRSNDLWYGFCNDQYCFSKLLEMVANELGIEVGWYYHFTSNLHLYNDFLGLNDGKKSF
jgi:thymidylate synthase